MCIPGICAVFEQPTHAKNTHTQTHATRSPQVRIRRHMHARTKREKPNTCACVFNHNNSATNNQKKTRRKRRTKRERAAASRIDFHVLRERVQRTGKPGSATYCWLVEWRGRGFVVSHTYTQESKRKIERGICDG